jgi:GT2 family glycosyltransferase/glycosyltransferase involved in cell wall biosynthesis
MAPFVRVVVLNRNSAWSTRRCLRALAVTEHPADRLEIVLVDDGSVDGSLEQLRHEFGDLTIIATGRRLGAAESLDRAMRERDGVDHVALVGHDVVVEPGWLSALLAGMAGDPAVGAVAARIVLEPGFVPIDVEGPGAAAVVSVAVDGLDVTRAVHRPLDVPWRIWVPAPADANRIDLRLSGSGPVTVRVSDPAAPGPDVRAKRPGTVGLDVPAGRRRLLGGLGTTRGGSGERVELRAGDVDGDDLEQGDVDGFSRDGVLLRCDLLDQVGLFDPRLFDRHLDADLSARARAAGWRIVTAPAAVLHRPAGGADDAGPETAYLERRNRWLTSDRFGSVRERAAVSTWVRRSAGRALRDEVAGRLRRGRTPRPDELSIWARVAADHGAELRRPRQEVPPIGAADTEEVVGRFQPRPTLPTPAPRPGGPLVVFVDVSDTIRNGWWAGIQRVVRALVTHLPDVAPELEVVPVAFVPEPPGFRRITADEYALLLRRAPVSVAPVVDPTLRRRAVGRFERSAWGWRYRRAKRALPHRPTVQDDLALGEFPRGSVFLDIDAVWNRRSAPRADLLPDLRRRGVRVVPLVYDLLPLQRPEWFVPGLVDEFGRAVEAQVRSADEALAISADTAAGVRDLARGWGRPDLQVTRVALGADPVRPPDDGTDAALPPELEGVDYLLVVGTIEPRKNQQLALDAFERIAATDPDLHLVVVGRAGWAADDVVVRLRAAARDPRIHWFESMGDDALDALYRSAFLTLVTSITEGYGLPLAESVARGTAVVSSPGGGLSEAGEAVAEFVDPHDPVAWAATVLRHRSDPDHHAAAVARARGAHVTTWKETARSVADALLAPGPSTPRR